MRNARAQIGVVAAFLVLGAAAIGGARAMQFLYAGPTVNEYLDHRGKAARLATERELAIDGQALQCGRYPAVLDAKLNDYGAAYFGFIVLHPDRFAALTPVLKRYAFRHECAHQYVGYDEGEADCHAIREGRREGWLDARALDEICAFISQSKGDSAHALGERRCTMMRRCFAGGKPGRVPL